MEDTRKELERIQKGLLSQETVSLDELLADEELNSLLNEPNEPAFDDTEKIHDPAKPLVYNNFANDYGEKERNEANERIQARKKKRDDRTVIGLMITACCLCLGIIGVLAYWLTVLL